jgi:hypothetical protein
MDGLHGITFERPVSAVKEAIEKRDTAMAALREKHMQVLTKSLAEEREKKLDAETVLRLLKGRRFRMAIPMPGASLSERVRDALKAAEVIGRIDEAREIYAFMKEQLAQEKQDRVITLLASEALTILRPFDADTFEAECCGFMDQAPLGFVPNHTQVGQVLGVRGVGQTLDSVEAALTSDLDS